MYKTMLLGLILIFSEKCNDKVRLVKMEVFGTTCLIDALPHATYKEVIKYDDLKSKPIMEPELMKDLPYLYNFDFNKVEMLVDYNLPNIFVVLKLTLSDNSMKFISLDPSGNMGYNGLSFRRDTSLVKELCPFVKSLGCFYCDKSK
ncbi:MAG: hypothetical protein AB8B53_13500 [Flavobacteriales bacterium]